MANLQKYAKIKLGLIYVSAWQRLCIIVLLSWVIMPWYSEKKKTESKNIQGLRVDRYAEILCGYYMQNSFYS